MAGNREMSRIVILVGSMRERGNSATLARSFARGAEEHNEVRILFVSDYAIGPCTGCNSCYTSDGNHCVLRDDMELVYDELRLADIVVVASPVYFYGLSSSLKALIDRLHAPLRTSFNIRALGLLLVAATDIPHLFDPILMQYKMTLDFFHLGDIGTITVGGVRDEGDIIGNPALDEAYRLGKSLK